jgi:hypothetical protein
MSYHRLLKSGDEQLIKYVLMHYASMYWITIKEYLYGALALKFLSKVLVVCMNCMVLSRNVTGLLSSFSRCRL